MTKRILPAVCLLAALAAPSTALAHPPTSADRTNASKECRTERSTTGTEAFSQKYGTAKSGYKNAFGKCVSSRARDEHAERHAAKRSANEDCREERANDPAAFRTKYGTARSNYKNAWGKCVSGKAKQKEAAADRADRRQMNRERNAAQECAAERDQMGEQPFAQKYGTPGSNYSNAFGKCVSFTAKS